MSKQQSKTTPGTVSKILWHFTGGPRKNPTTEIRDEGPKPAEEAYKSLGEILASHELQARCIEGVKALIWEMRVNERTGVFEPMLVHKELDSAMFCCISDIPIQHLAYHSNQYGKFAIGFRREVILTQGFNPVFYTLKDTPIIQSVSRALSALRSVDISQIREAAETLSEADSSFIDFEALQIGEDVRRADENLKHFLAFVKTFTIDEFATIYCEREWRSLRTYHFEKYDEALAMIVLPRKEEGREYFDDFCRRAERLELPRSIPIVPWEDLIEH
jgi:hypothetical protein